MNAPDSISTPAAPAPKHRKRLFWSLMLLVLLPAFLVGSLYGGRKVWRMWDDRKVGELNAQAESFYAKRDIEATMRVLRSIMIEHPLNERGLRLWARMLDGAPHNAEDAVAIWRKVCSLPQATPADHAALGLALLHTGRYKEAHGIWEALPASERQHLGGLKLESSLLRFEGDVRAADAVLRKAYEAAPGDPESRLKLAVLDLDSSFPDIHAVASQRIWEMVRQGHGAEAVNAMEALAGVSDLTSPQAAELLERLARMPDVTGAPRYAILTGCLRALPSQRAQILDRETAGHSGRLDESSADFLRWLLQNRESARILNVLDRNVALNSPHLFPIYAEALNSTGHWKELRTLLTTSPAPPLSPGTAAVMLSYCSYKLGEAPEHAYNHLKEALHHARSRNAFPELFITGTSAEEMGFTDLALEAFNEVSEHRAYRITALDHVLNIRRQQRNLSEIIETLEALLADSPGLAPYLDLYCYHKILAGEDMEKTAALAQHAVASGRQSSPTLHLALALASYRQHDFKAALDEAKTLRAIDLPSGQRAVLAGILEACGDAAEAYQLAEKISPRLLLVEESRFLKGAL